MHEVVRQSKRSDRRTKSSPPAGAVRGRLPMELQALQRAAGNAAVARMMAREQPTVTQRMEASTTVAPEVVTTEEDRGLLRQYRDETDNAQVKALLDELLGHLEKVSSFKQTTGSTTGGYTRNLGNGKYGISYALPSNLSDRIAVLVHELTHVAVNEAYKSDMLNYPVPELTATDLAIAQEGAPSGVEERMQLARLRRVSNKEKDRFIDKVHASADELKLQLPNSNLSPQRKALIADKLQFHTSQRPFHEYDAVLSHILIWCDRDKADKDSRFYKSLTSMVAEASEWRTKRTINLPETQSPEQPNVMSAALSTGGRTRTLAERVKKMLTKLARVFKFKKSDGRAPER
jgi:hypothetical protein